MINTVIIINGNMVWRLKRKTGGEESGCCLQPLPLPGGVTLGNALGLGLRLSSWLCLGSGSKGPGEVSKPLDGPGLVPSIPPATYSASPLLKVKRDKSKLWSSIAENAGTQWRVRTSWGCLLSLPLTLISGVCSFYLSTL